MTEFQARNPRNAVKLLTGAFHDDTVLVKVHIAAHIGHITHHALLVDNDLRPVQALDHQLVILHEWNFLMLSEMFAQVTEHRTAARVVRKHQIYYLFICIFFISRNRDLPDPDGAHARYDHKQQK